MLTLKFWNIKAFLPPIRAKIISDNIKFPTKQRTSITISEVPGIRQAHKQKGNNWYKNVIDSLQQTNLIILIDYYQIKVILIMNGQHGINDEFIDSIISWYAVYKLWYLKLRKIWNL